MVWIFGLLMACQSDSNNGFSTTGTDTVNPDSVTTGSDGDGNDGSSSSSGGVNPVITDMEGFVDVDGGSCWRCTFLLKMPKTIC